SVNMWGAFHLARAAANELARRGGGSIVLFSSQGAFTGGYQGSAVYAMTKAAVGTIIKSLAHHYALKGVRVNGIAPGLIDTDMMRGGLDAGTLERLMDLIPLKRFGTPGEVATCCAFLASPLAQYVTGQMLHVNGGQLML